MSVQFSPPMLTRGTILNMMRLIISKLKPLNSNISFVHLSLF